MSTTDWIVPEFPHDENSKDCITIQQYLDALYEGDTVREYASARHVLSRDEDHALLGSSSIKFVSVNSLEYTNKTAVNRRDLSGLLSKIESGDSLHERPVRHVCPSGRCSPRDDRPRLTNTTLS